MIIFCCIFFAFSISAMEPGQKNPEVAEIVKEIEANARPQHEKLAQLINHERFGQQVSGSTYMKLRKICKPVNAPLLKRLLERKIVNANTFFTGVSEGKKYKIGFLAEAIHYGLQKKNFVTVEILLQNNADPDQELGSVLEIFHAQPTTALSRALDYLNMPLLRLLLKYKTNPNRVISGGSSPLMFCTWLYCQASSSVPEDVSKKYEAIKLLLDRGALIDNVSTLPSSMLVSTPLLVAKESSRAKELLELFNNYPNNWLVSKK